jgi:hypothetical protein
MTRPLIPHALMVEACKAHGRPVPPNPWDKAKELLDAGKLEESLTWLGSFERVEWLPLVLEKLDGLEEYERAHRLLAQEWPSLDGIREYAEEYLHWFIELGPIGTIPTEPVTVYRGVTRPGDWRGISWTTDIEVARHFAYRDRAGGAGRLGSYIYQANVGPSDVLATFDEGEAELIVCYDSLELAPVGTVQLIEGGPR